MKWERVKAGEYCSEGGQWVIERGLAGEVDAPPLEEPQTQEEWFLYCAGDMIDGFPRLKDAKAHVERNEKDTARAKEHAAKIHTLSDKDIFDYLTSEKFAVDLAEELPRMEGKNRERGSTSYYPPLPTEWLMDGEAAEEVERAIKSCLEHQAYLKGNDPS